MAEQRLDRAQVTKAVEALLKYVRAQAGEKKALLGESDVVSLVVALQKVPETGRNKPFPIRIPHALIRTDEGADICLIVKDSKEMKAALEKKPVPGVSKVISLEKLRSNYPTYADKRKLCDSYALFLADDRIVPMLPKTLGKNFYERKKQPVPVCLTRANIGAAIAAARDATYLYLGWGACSAVRVARTDFSVVEVVDNIMAAAEGVAGRVPRKWAGIQALHIKSTSSVALPIYQALPGEEADAGAAAASAAASAVAPAATPAAGSAGKAKGGAQAGAAAAKPVKSAAAPAAAAAASAPAAAAAKPTVAKSGGGAAARPKSSGAEAAKAPLQSAARPSTSGTKRPAAAAAMGSDGAPAAKKKKA